MRFVILFVALAGCATTRTLTSDSRFAVQPLHSGTSASLRGLSVVDERVAWTSGTDGMVLRTTDGGATWQQHKVPGADFLDFRDVHAFDALTAYVLSIGETGRIYVTRDGGATWTLQFSNRVPGAFFDCLDFYDRRNGLAMSDPVGGQYLLLRTADGTSWTELPAASRPQATEGEAAFAASGTCLTIAGDRAYLASGGGAQARVFWSADRGNTWHAVATPVSAGVPAAGIFTLAFRDENHGVALGGDYEKPAVEATVAVTSDGGRSWNAVGRTSYTSGAAWSRSGRSLIAVGTPGTRVSPDRGQSWTSIDTVEYNAVQFASEDVAYAVGPRGRIAKLLRR